MKLDSRHYALSLTEIRKLVDIIDVVICYKEGN